MTIRTIEGVELGAQHAPAQGPQGVAPVARIGQCLQECVDRVRMRQGLGIARPVVRGPVQFLPVSGLLVHRPLVEPGLGEERRGEVLVEYRLEPCLRPMGAGRVIVGEGLGVELLHHAEAAELALRPVPVAVVIAVLGRELALGDLVDHLDARHHLHGKGQRRCASASRVVSSSSR